MEENPYEAPADSQYARQHSQPRKPPWLVIVALFVLSAMSGMAWLEVRADMKGKLAASCLFFGGVACYTLVSSLREKK